eukprot:c22966_g1_i1 orf=255-620(-)
MEAYTSSSQENGCVIDGMAWQKFQKNFSEVQNILNQNRILINEINLNHESKEHENLTRNVTLLRELNGNITRVMQLYTNLSGEFLKSMEASSEESTATLNTESASAIETQMSSGQKRIRPM